MMRLSSKRGDAGIGVKRLELRPEALEDLFRIWDWSEQHWGEAQADRYVDDIRTAWNGLAAGTVRSRPSRISDFRLKAVGSHVIYLLESDNAITVVRILHDRMDAERHLPR